MTIDILSTDLVSQESIKGEWRFCHSPTDLSLIVDIVVGCILQTSALFRQFYPKSAVAKLAMDLQSPSSPTCSFVVAVMPILWQGIPRIALILLRILSIYGASIGLSAIIDTATFLRE